MHWMTKVLTMKTLYKLAILLSIALSLEALHAEPFLAVRTGMKCMACHVNPAGGGKRTAFGQIYGQTVLPSKATTTPLGEVVSRHLDIGADLRSSLTATQMEDEDNQLAFATDRATFYLEGKLIPQRLTFYLDQRFAPGVSSREAWLMYKTGDQNWFLKAGSFFLPYGHRLEDDTAFIREATGVSFNNADNGLMLGHDSGPWSTRFSLTNGTNGGAETNTNKQGSLRVAFIKSKWRAGISTSINKGIEGTSRDMYNIFGAVNMWGLEWLAEVDWVTDKSEGSSDITQQISFAEVNKELFKGHNIKFSYEYLDPNTDIDEDQRNRMSLLWEYTPISLLQLRVGTRISDGIPQISAQNSEVVFAQLHVWF